MVLHRVRALAGLGCPGRLEWTYSTQQNGGIRLGGVRAFRDGGCPATSIVGAEEENREHWSRASEDRDHRSRLYGRRFDVSTFTSRTRTPGGHQSQQVEDAYGAVREIAYEHRLCCPSRIPRSSIGTIESHDTALSRGYSEPLFLELRHIFFNDVLLPREVLGQFRIKFDAIVDPCPDKPAVADVARHVDGAAALR